MTATRSKVSKGHYGSLTFSSIDNQNWNSSNGNVVYGQGYISVHGESVTPTSDPPLRGQMSKGQFHLTVIYNFIIRARFTKIYQQIPYTHMSLWNAGFNSERSFGVNRGHWPFKLQKSISQEGNTVEFFNLNENNAFWPYLRVSNFSQIEGH